MFTVAIHQPHYLPYCGYLDKWDQADLLILLDDAQFTRGGWQNRNYVKTAQGRQLLTVPVQHEGFRPLRETRIDHTRRWDRAHRRTLEQAYAQAPYRYLLPLITEETYYRRWPSIGELALGSTFCLGRHFGIPTPTVLASTLRVPGSGSRRLADLCRAVEADAYLAGDGSRVYLDERPFEEAGIEVVWQNFVHPRWPQLHHRHGFISHLSGLDLLLNTGPDALTVLRGTRLFTGAAS
ncbi:WbqC family protein [Streptomyces acidiscabies]|uniref:WbqC family protein n=1 Tax=Streptomyces acidiscabies TaxID=42234 RepID=UPI00096702F2|nr:WbqC family protein [Streptomyces acidiscabies]GAV38288.1 WbqC-like protein family protein [Streptomyces acidiscabies]